MGDPFLRTRFAVPARPGTFLRRERLAELLDRAPRAPLVMVDGPAGAGKTLLVADWAAGLGRPVAWLTLDASIGEPHMFWPHVARALHTSGPRLPLGLGRPAAGHRAGHSLLNRLAARLSGEEGEEGPVTLVIDDYDRATADVSEQLAYLLRHARPGLRLVLVTRTEPLLPLHTYRAAGEMSEIRAADLAFTPGEAVALLELHGLDLGVGAAHALVERTRGWAAGLRLCALAARESPDPRAYLKEFEAGHSTVADFLLAEVLGRQSSRTQDLLLRVSVLERFCPDLANALTGRTDAAAVLAALHRENAFVEDLGHAWYRLHPLFREILHAHLLERRPGLEPDLHRRAAHWLRRSGTLAEMLAHGAAAGDWEFIAGALVEDLAIGQLMNGLRLGDVPEPFAVVETGTTGPATELVRAARHLAEQDVARGQVHLRRAGQRLAADDSGPAAARLSGALLEALAARLSGSPARAERAARAGRELEREVPAQLLDRHPEVPALLLTHVGATRVWAGDFDGARAALAPVADGRARAATAVPRQDALALLALIDCLDGRPGGAERAALAALAETDRFSLPRSPGRALAQLVLAAVAVDRDELRRAQDLIGPASGPVVRDPVAAAGRSLAVSRLLLARGRPDAALRATAAAAAVPTDVASPWARCEAALVVSAVRLGEGDPDAAVEALREAADGHPAGAVGEARARLAAGDRRAALAMLDMAVADRRAGPAVRVRAALVRARAAYGEGDDAATRRLLADALRGARRDRLRRPFREAGPWIEPFLASSALRCLAVGWLVPDGQGPAPEAAAEPVMTERLSGREHDVLTRLAQVMSTDEIAADLYVSVNTVKTHLKSVYRKLGVNRRQDAVRRARRLGLL
ncbi:LuxR C-terminal-related transcriptional regulator [Streptomyces sp. NPDC018610]|uniref:LuxR C-terminal-related transcriptional regulator n=1 Tax=Streptomyces sp. NPDC018610 TaxID=3365049 RepID=UPI0037ABE57B